MDSQRPIPPLPAPRCIACGYVLTGLDSPSPCPECGRPFDLLDPSSYSFKVPFVGWRYWLPGLALAAGAGIGLAGILSASGNWGWSIWIAVPFAAGCILGYGVRFRIYVMGLLSLALTVAIIVGLMSLNLAGIFCTLALSGILLVPILVGAAAGEILRSTLKRSGFSQRTHLPILLFIAFPLACGAIEGSPPGFPIETVATTHILEAGPDECWDSIVFYENVTHEPPWLLKVGLARPLSTAGPSGRVGDVRRCIYNRGHITKVITGAERPLRLAFAVTEQQIGYERDVRLIGGAFAFRRAAPMQTEVTLSTTYQPRLSPRFAWRPFEHYACHLLHGYVLDGMARRLDPPTRTLSEAPR